jgi:catechol 2,3-dioxygenase-like lactoylglutathione lyase family enzyme
MMEVPRKETHVRRLLAVVAVFCLARSCLAQVPGFYKAATRVTWIVENIDKVRPAWEALGLKDIEEYPNTAETATYEGKPTTIDVWQITGHLENLTVDMIQPAEGQLNAYTHFLEKHGDGIFSIVHEVPTQAALEQEIARMRSKGVGVLQRVTMPKQDATLVYFDTEAEGKYNLGLVLHTGANKPTVTRPQTISHFGFDVRDLPTVSAYWQKLGFPAFRIEQAAPRVDSRYKGQPLSLAFEVGYQKYDQFSYEWIAAPPMPANIYADYLKAPHHREGIQHLGMPVADLREAIAASERLGYHVRQSGAWGDVGKADSGEYAYLDTDTGGGVSVELIHSY